MNQIPTDAVDKIVVTKGAASVLYGANAEGGVVNIITKKAVATPKPLVSATTEVGDGGYNREVFSSGWKKGIFSYWVSYTRDELPSWRLSDDFSPTIGTLTYRRVLMVILLPPKPTRSFLKIAGIAIIRMKKAIQFLANSVLNPARIPNTLRISFILPGKKANP